MEEEEGRGKRKEALGGSRVSLSNK